MGFSNKPEDDPPMGLLRGGSDNPLNLPQEKGFTPPKAKEITQAEWEEMKTFFRLLSEATAEGRFRVQSISEADAEAAAEAQADKESAARRNALPAVYIDKWHFTYWKGHIRISLGESSSSAGTGWRFAALMELNDVRRLAGRMLEMADKTEKDKDEE